MLVVAAGIYFIKAAGLSGGSDKNANDIVSGMPGDNAQSGDEIVSPKDENVSPGEQQDKPEILPGDAQDSTASGDKKDGANGIEKAEAGGTGNSDLPKGSAITNITREEKEMLENMTLREKVGQLFIIRPESLVTEYRGYETELTDDMREVFDRYPCGGIALFEKNITGEEQVMKFTADINSLKYNPLVCIDEEGGKVSRISHNPNMPIDEIPDMQDIAATNDAYEAYKVGDNIGSYLSKYGFDVDFAPVADVNTNPDNPIIGVRAFGDDPVTAGAMVAAVVDGLHNNKIAGCLKHYPGHGDTKTDTHLGYAETMKTWDEIKNCEMVPFIAGMNANADMIMVAHIAAPNVTGSDEPATLSYTLITEKLRNELRYQGVIITDAIEMKAITDLYSSGEASVKCLQAGADIVLMPADYREAFDAVVKAVEDGVLTEERINESLIRVLRLKAKCAN